MRFLFVAVLSCLISLSIASGNIEEEQIPQAVLDHFYRELPSDTPLFLDLYAGKFTGQITRLLKERLINDGYTLYETKQQDSLILKMTFEDTSSEKKSGYFPFRSTITETKYTFSLQITKLPENRIVSFDTLSLTTLTSERSSNMKWYDPILITGIIGALAYLFYFGE